MISYLPLRANLQEHVQQDRVRLQAACANAWIRIAQISEKKEHGNRPFRSGQSIPQIRGFEDTVGRRKGNRGSSDKTGHRTLN